ncbi:hypothetical protein J2Z79_002800 [Symbiobacterium terraclitae]|uniref:Uncharacterized protein n=1 Tax=Symbiobacterium terraclitae TaxID=557451 RepID=A0ABS4JUZ6_9FIRM|nr:DUF3303 family protein [Symbiobacterium terraclitae]MBP2019361.1 hypothetical protein [Symbiobacterium terraclitae]
MRHLVIMRHSPESCPGRPENEAVHPCFNKMQDLLDKHGVATVGKWADPPAHVSYIVLDAPNAHVIQEAIMESGLFLYTTTTEVRPVLSMD